MVGISEEKAQYQIPLRMTSGVILGREAIENLNIKFLNIQGIL